jgi:Kef-type K+ transport system membrane component KefB
MAKIVQRFREKLQESKLDWVIIEVIYYTIILLLTQMMVEMISRYARLDRTGRENFCLSFILVFLYAGFKSVQNLKSYFNSFQNSGVALAEVPIIKAAIGSKSEKEKWKDVIGADE